MLLWTDSLCGAAEIVLCTYRILFYNDDLYFLSCRTLYTAVDNETLLDKSLPLLVHDLAYILPVMHDHSE